MGSLNLYAIKIWWESTDRGKVDDILRRCHKDKLETMLYSSNARVNCKNPDYNLLAYILNNTDYIGSKTDSKWFHIDNPSASKFNRIKNRPVINDVYVLGSDEGRIAYYKHQAQELWNDLFKPMQLGYYDTPVNIYTKAIAICVRWDAVYEYLIKYKSCRQDMERLYDKFYRDNIIFHVAVDDVPISRQCKYVGISYGSPSTNYPTAFVKYVDSIASSINEVWNMMSLFNTYGLMDDNIMREEYDSEWF